MAGDKDKDNPTKVVEVESSPSSGLLAQDPTPGDNFNEPIYPDNASEALAGAVVPTGADTIGEILAQTKIIDDDQRKPGDTTRSNYSRTDRTGLPTSETNALYNQDGMVFGFGYFGQPSLEPKPTFVALPSETIYDSQVNAQIVIGPYKPTGILSPGIIRGETRNATIDLVAGRLGSYAATVTKDNEKIEELRNSLRENQVDLARVIDKLSFEPGAQDVQLLQLRRDELEARYFQNRQKLADLISSSTEQKAYCNNSYKLDAARVTICQRGNVDEHFGIRPGGVGTSRDSSYVALKADDLRFVARDSIKIVTGTDDETSQGGNIHQPRGIDLIAFNDDQDVQLMVKGQNLLECLTDIIKDISDVNGSLVDFFTQQMAYNTAIAFHTHTLIPDPTSPTLLGTLPSLSLSPVWLPTFIQGMTVTFPSLIIEKYNYMAVQIKYLTPLDALGVKHGPGNKYILSKGNRTN